MHSPTPGGDWESALPIFDADAKGMATRAASGKVIDAIFPAVPALMGGSADLTPSNKTQAKGAQDFSARDARRPLHPLRRARARDGRDPQRPHAPRRAARLRRHVPRLLRLHESRRPPLGADGDSRDVDLHPRLDRARRGRTDAPARRADRRASARSRTCTSSARPTRTRRRRRGASPSADPTGRRCSRSAGRACPRSTAPSTPRPKARGAARTCSPTPTASRT